MAIDGGTLGGIESQLSDYLIEDKINSRDFVDCLDRLQWLGFIIAKFVNASLNGEFLMLPPETVKLKEELIKKYEKEIAKGDILTIAKIEAELIADSKKRVKDNPSYQIYESGGRGSFGNNYKNTSIMRGAIKNLADSDQVHISTSSLIDGIPPEELEYYGDLITQASYGRAVGTREGGYEAKKLSAAFQNVTLGEPGSDCGTKKYHLQEIDKGNIGLFMYRYVIEGSKLTLISSENKDQFVGKVVKLRTPIFCTGHKYCSKCAGELYYRLGIYNVGILTNRVGTSLLNASLKAFHDMSLKVKEINIDDYID